MVKEQPIEKPAVKEPEDQGSFTARDATSLRCFSNKPRLLIEDCEVSIAV